MTGKIKLRKKPPDCESGGCATDEVQGGTPYLSSNGRFFIEVPPTDGFRVDAESGKVKITQEPVCAEVQTVILQTTEARKLLAILPKAIQSAEKLNGGSHG